MNATRKALAAGLAALSLLAVSACGSDSESGSTDEVEVFTWWAEGSEKAGLDALVKVFDEQNPDLKFVNGAVAGGAGSDAKNVLQSRLQNGEPPATFQAHAGAELTDYINAGQIEDLTDLYEEKGWNEQFPEGLLERLKQDGGIYSVPSNIHRANVLWSNPAVLKKAGIEANKSYDSLGAWIADLEKIKAKGIIPLSIATDWTQVHLLETVLLADLGAEAYNGLWDGSTDWAGSEVKAALGDYSKLIALTNTDRQGLDWPDATQLVIDGEAAFNIMGDWAEAAFQEQGKKLNTDYTAVPVPGTEGVFDFLADSFTMPVDGPNPEGTEAWLDTIASDEGQVAFNKAKGSIPASTTADTASFGEYQQTAIKSWSEDEIVSSLAHGAATSVNWLTDITAAVAKFGSNKDVAGLQEGLAEAAEDNKPE
ncbi:glucose/mannose transport system substrate-binding protein [Nocardioides luteus]|uniref:Probable sugar-binding periplasmic protein n=1 Tax=Nocardioides luteus TaxID=1844 RepID=A0ABQ5SRX0_9ACTN|nr:ABC transporter substrate-binding protein [Nocardioides luteus]MDR7311223.1 glucose/mannose transport system substrate-binding protein [Nocardioides luteus]GGR63139.1 sugar ABC transporter substrate-binding protein [Nocardioides luteus]GLJ66770.1 sugar ABC transporter substrate-binding protein [Nocardioides luteus]